MISETITTTRIFSVCGLLMLVSTGCSIDDIREWGYRITKEYACENHAPNIPRRQVECMEEGLSFEEYEEARRKESEKKEN